MLQPLFALVGLLFFSTPSSSPRSYEGVAAAPLTEYTNQQPAREELLNEIPISLKAINGTEVIPGSSFDILIEMNIPQGWHIYWKNPGDSGAPTTFTWRLPEGVKLESLDWPIPDQFTSGPLSGYGYEGMTIWRARFSTRADLPSKQDKILLTASWIGCKESCVPGESQAEISISFVDNINQEKNAASNEENPTKQLFPTPQKATVQIEKDTLLLTVSLREPLVEAIFFPIKPGLLPTQSQFTWEQKENKIIGTLLIDTDLKKRLQREGKLEGVLKVITPSSTFGFILDESIEGTLSSPSSQSLTKNLTRLIEQPSGENLLTIAILAFLGGIILNFMPCVLPVIGIKVLHLSQMRFMGRWKTFQIGLFFTIGTLVSFLSLAAIIYTLQFSGKALGWGFQLQEPLFVMSLIIVLFLFSLSLFGVFEIGTKVAAIAGTQESTERMRLGKHSRFASFLSGVLTTIVATPCTGPLLGSVLGFSATLEWHMGLLVFSSLGLGMASPFLLFSLFPELASVFPKPGAWMNTFKQFLGFSMLGTVLWLIWVLTSQRPQVTGLVLSSQLFLIAIAAWIYGTWGGVDRGRFTRLFSTSLALLLLGFASNNLLKATKESAVTTAPQGNLAKATEAFQDWKPYSEELLEKLLGEKKSVLVDFTAKWCLTCQANKLVLYSSKVRAAFRKHDVQLLIADWTTNDEKITAALRKLGRNSVPVNALYLRGEKTPILLPELLTPQSIITALEGG